MARLQTDIKANQEILAKNPVSTRTETEKKAEVKRVEEQQHALKTKLDELHAGNVSQLGV